MQLASVTAAVRAAHESLVESLRILFVSEYFPPSTLGGAEWSSAEQAAALVAAGHRVTVLTFNYGAPAEEVWRGIRVVRAPFPQKLSAGQTVKQLYFQNPLFYGYLALWCWRIARRERPHLIHAHSTFSVIGAYLASRRLGCPLVVTLRDTMHVCSVGAICLHQRELPPHRCSIGQYRICFDDFQRSYFPALGPYRRFKARLRHWLEIVDTKLRQAALARADRVLTVSRALGEIYRASGVVSGSTRTVYNPAATEAPRIGAVTARAELQIPAESPVVLCAGKLSFGKGTPELLRAVQSVHATRPDVHFVLAGRTTHLIPVPEDPRVHVTGPLPHDRVLALHEVADVVVLPSVWKEPFPRVLLEAMAAGRAVVATRTGGIPELVEDGVTGLLVPARDPCALAAALLKVLGDDSLRKRLRCAGRERVLRRFTSEETCGLLVGAYRETLGSTRAGCANRNRVRT